MYAGNPLIARPGPNDPPNSLRLHDSANYGTGFTVRGNPMTMAAGGTSRLVQYDIMGMPEKSTTGSASVEATPDANRNYAVPSTITPNSTSQLSHALIGAAIWD